VTFTETERRSTGIDVAEIVVGVRDSYPGVLGRVGIRVTNESSLVMVVELAIRHCDTGATMRNVE